MASIKNLKRFHNSATPIAVFVQSNAIKNAKTADSQINERKRKAGKKEFALEETGSNVRCIHAHNVLIAGAMRLAEKAGGVTLKNIF